MFGLARRYVKTALAYFALGLLLGAWMLVQQAMGIGIHPSMVSAHTHLTLIGFMVTLIMGVAYWMFPRPAREDMRYSPSMAEINYWLITIGTGARFAGETAQAFHRHPAEWVVIMVGAAMQIAAGFIFVWNIWTRIRAVGSQIRESKGEKF